MTSQCMELLYIREFVELDYDGRGAAQPEWEKDGWEIIRPRVGTRT